MPPRKPAEGSGVPNLARLFASSPYYLTRRNQGIRVQQNPITGMTRTGYNRRMGRPPLPPDQRSVTTVGVRLLGVDHAAMRALLALPTPLATDASGLLRELLRREARAQGFLPPDPRAKVSEPPAPPATPGGPSSAPGHQGYPTGAATPLPVPGVVPLPAPLLGGLLPPGALLLVWPPGWPLPIPSPYAGGAALGMVPPVRTDAPEERSGSVSAPTSPPPVPRRAVTASTSSSTTPRRSASASRESTPGEPSSSAPEPSSTPRPIP